MNGIIDAYEKYFSNLVSFQFDLHKRKQHDCLICSTDITEGIYSRKFTEEFIINYLEHLKVFGYCIKLTEIFIQSVRDNGILASKVKGHWLIRKHDTHEVFIIEHVCIHEEKENEKEKEKENKLKHLERGLDSDF